MNTGMFDADSLVPMRAGSQARSKRVPLPSHRHASPSAPWPCVDIEDGERYQHFLKSTTLTISQRLIPYNSNLNCPRFHLFVITNPAGGVGGDIHGPISELGRSAGEEEQDLQSNNGLLEGFGMYMPQSQRDQGRIFHQSRISGCES